MPDKTVPFTAAQIEAADRCRVAMRLEPGDICPINVPGRLCPKFCQCKPVQYTREKADA